MDPAVIIGAGQAGAHAAAAMRQAGFADPILLIGDEVERPHERPPLSKAVLTDDEAPAVSFFHADDFYRGNGIEFVGGVAATGLDVAARSVQLADGREMTYARLLLATGGRARRLDVPGAERVLALRTLDDAHALRSHLRPGARVACIGAGVIGLEIASSARKRGCEVSVVEAAPAVMARSLAPELSTWLADVHREAGVALELGTSVAAVTPEGVECSDGRLIRADIVVAGIGMERNTDLAAAAGLEVDGGIAVDEFGRTSAPNVFAAGDVAAFWMPRLGRRLRWETWRHAQDHGAAVGRAMAGAGTPYDAVPWFWTDQHGRALQVAGEPSGTVVLRGQVGAAPFSAWYLDANGVVAGVVGVDAPRDVRAGQSLIRAARPVDPALIADLAIPPQKLAKA